MEMFLECVWNIYIVLLFIFLFDWFGVFRKDKGINNYLIRYIRILWMNFLVKIKFKWVIFLLVLLGICILICICIMCFDEEFGWLR